MGFPAGDYCKLVIGGACGTDSWSIGVFQKLTGLTGNPTPSQMNANALARLNGFNNTIWSAATNSLKAQNASGVTLATCKNYLYRSGVLTAQGTASITPVVGTSAVPVPFYVSMCASLLTNQPGRSGRGRMYLPLTGSGFNAGTGQMTLTLGTMASNVALFLTGLGPDDNTFPGDPTSEADVVSITHGLSNKITTVRIDSIPDTQHGRTRRVTATATGSASV